MQIFKDGLS
jgi:hypothetical protein